MANRRQLPCVAAAALAAAAAIALSPTPATAAPATPNDLKGLGSATQAIIIEAPTASSSRATLGTFALKASSWQPVRTGLAARIGYRGMSQPTSRHEGDGTTPMGIYSLVYGFGSKPNPGMTGFKWRRTNPLACWSSTRSSYNRWVARKPCRAPDENLWASRNLAYRYAAVLDFNYTHPIFGRGSAIFLHVMRPGRPTAGCISMAENDLLAILKWVRPGVRVVIGTSASLAALRAP